MTARLPEPARAKISGRIDRAWFANACFPDTFELPIRFDDLDVNWHVNNVAVIALLQEARVHFNQVMALPRLDDSLRTVVAAMNIEYAGELSYPGSVTIKSGIISLGRTSFTFGQMIRQNGQNAVFSQITMVVTDAAGPASIPDALRAAIAQYCLIRE